MPTPSDASAAEPSTTDALTSSAREEVEVYQRQLRRLAAELSLSEARQRRIIAGELHDHIGQALAFIRLRLVRLQGDAVFSGFEDSVSEILRLVDQTINSTRSLTFQVSPPMLYELGLGAALEWLGETLGVEDGPSITAEIDPAVDAVPDDTRVLLFQAVRELMVNAIKHADPREVRVVAGLSGDDVVVSISDDGCGFDPDRAMTAVADDMGFGLFSIRERLCGLGGSMEVASTRGSGTRVMLSVPARPPWPEEAP